ncbi:MAG: 2-amino-4-hydroxy-6-hydroxymethyldihydropteridine diphosphokinase [Candidatus Aminicenantes bacterium]|nr:MAG: 2-amino-4-hydroxy-6-hydroxymethyldihydropteridine diphosphokinase [Candidatus Aminicenantes bacterium]
MIYYLSLGSNVGDKAANIKKAIDFLQGIGDILEVSFLYETEPVGMKNNAGDFYNLVLGVRTSLAPVDLLLQIKEFEKHMGRDIAYSHNLPRTIDIDILLAGDQVINSEELVIPHKEMTKRAFVLIPLNEIAPEVVHPVLKKPIKEILEQLPAKFKMDRVKKIGPLSLNF